MQQARLMRSETDRMIAGVCGGLAEYLNVDPVLVRLAFVVLGLASGVGLVLYVLLWLLMPTPSRGWIPFPVLTAARPKTSWRKSAQTWRCSSPARARFSWPAERSWTACATRKRRRLSKPEVYRIDEPGAPAMAGAPSTLTPMIREVGRFCCQARPGPLESASVARWVQPRSNLVTSGR